MMPLGNTLFYVNVVDIFVCEIKLQMQLELLNPL